MLGVRKPFTKSTVNPLGHHGEEVNSFITLRSGNKMPTIGLGTWLSHKDDVTTAVKHALDCGYRHLDCAKIYGNEVEIGRAIHDCLSSNQCKRQDLFITSKLWCTDHKPESVRKACLRSISDLQCDYLDLYLIHWPVALTETRFEPPVQLSEHTPLYETWRAMEDLVRDGLVKDIGVCNFNGQALIDLLMYANVKPSVLQIENHPLLQQNELLAFCQTQHIHVTGYSPLGHPNMDPSMCGGQKFRELLKDPVVCQIAGKIHKTPGQVLLRFGLQRGLVVIPKSTNKDRICENFGAKDFTLSDDDMKSISKLEKDYGSQRVADPFYFFGLPIFN